MTRPLVLLPPSKGRAEGGGAPAYGATLTGDGALDAPRREVLAAVVAAADVLAPAALARLVGVGQGRLAGHATVLRALADAPTLPAHRRFTGIVHANAGLAELDPAGLGVDARIVSGLQGLVAIDEPVPDDRIEFAASLPPLGGLATFWRRASADHLAELTADRPVWDLLPAEHARVWPPGLRERREHRPVRFVRPDGRAANAARTKVAKGRLARLLLTTPQVEPGDLVGHDVLGRGWELGLAPDGAGLLATWSG